MRLRPRHYVLIALIVGIGIFNYFRARRTHAPQPTAPVYIATGPGVQTPAWSAFDKAVALRDAPDNEFSPALQTLQQTVQTAAPSDTTVEDVKGCQMWLMFYRQGVLHPSKDATWRERSGRHLDSCMKTHHDAG